MPDDSDISVTRSDVKMWAASIVELPYRLDRHVEGGDRPIWSHFVGPQATAEPPRYGHQGRGIALGHHISTDVRGEQYRPEAGILRPQGIAPQIVADVNDLAWPRAELPSSQ